MFLSKVHIWTTEGLFSVGKSMHGCTNYKILARVLTFAVNISIIEVTQPIVDLKAPEWTSHRLFLDLKVHASPPDTLLSHSLLLDVKVPDWPFHYTLLELEVHS